MVTIGGSKKQLKGRLNPAHLSPELLKMGFHIVLENIVNHLVV
jgi:hypothetical protein